MLWDEKLGFYFRWTTATAENLSEYGEIVTTVSILEIPRVI